VIDTHCHLDASRFDPDRAAVLTRAWEAGVRAILVPGVEPEEWEPLRALCSSDHRLLPAFGIHPQALPGLAEDDDFAHLEQLDAALAKGGAIAVGECGLDGPSVERGAPIERQLRVLRGHFALARKHGLPLLLHCHRVQPALMQLLEEEKLPERGGVLHSYSGGPELAKIYGRYGLYFSFAGPVTWAEARKPVAAAREVALDRLLAETDSPDQAPAPHRGGRSEPAFLPHIVEGLARARGAASEELATATTENARRLFGPALDRALQ
jgi:TatD DNase family protein